MPLARTQPPNTLGGCFYATLIAGTKSAVLASTMCAVLGGTKSAARASPLRGQGACHLQCSNFIAESTRRPSMVSHSAYRRANSPIQRREMPRIKGCSLRVAGNLLCRRNSIRGTNLKSFARRKRIQCNCNIFCLTSYWIHGINFL